MLSPPGREGGLVGGGVGFVARSPACGTRKRAHEYLAITGKIITSPVASNCNLWAPCEHTASLLLRKRLFSVMLRKRFDVDWPDLCLLEKLEPGRICHRTKKVLSLLHISKKGSPLPLPLIPPLLLPAPLPLPGGRLEFIELTDANYPKRM